MSKIIPVQHDTLLTWEEFDSPEFRTERWMYGVLCRKAENHQWQPRPPIVVSPMPPEYKGKYQFFLYNGHTRLIVAREHRLPLDQLVVENDEEIPRSEWTGEIALGSDDRSLVDTLDRRMKYIICCKVQPHSKIANPKQESARADFDPLDLKYLLQEFRKFEEGRTAEYE